MDSLPPRRHHARYSCSIPAKIKISRSVKTIEGVLINIGAGGAMLRVMGTLTLMELVMEVTLKGNRYSLEATLKRSCGKDPEDSRYELYGLIFPDHPKTQESVAMLLDEVRRVNGSSSGATVMRDYWDLKNEEQT